MSDSFEGTMEGTTKKHHISDHEYTSYSAEECRDLFINPHIDGLSGSGSNSKEPSDHGKSVAGTNLQNIPLSRLSDKKKLMLSSNLVDSVREESESCMSARKTRRTVKVPKQYEDFFLGVNGKSKSDKNDFCQMQTNQSHVDRTSKGGTNPIKMTDQIVKFSGGIFDEVCRNQAVGSGSKVALSTSRISSSPKESASYQCGKQMEHSPLLSHREEPGSCLHDGDQLTELRSLIKQKIGHFVNSKDADKMCKTIQIHDEGNKICDFEISKESSKLVVTEEKLEDILPRKNVLSCQNDLLKMKPVPVSTREVAIQCSNLSESILNPPSNMTDGTKLTENQDDSGIQDIHKIGKKPNMVGDIIRNRMLRNEIVMDDATLSESSKSVDTIVNGVPLVVDKRLHSSNNKKRRSKVKFAQKMTQTTLCPQCGKHLSTVSSLRNHLLIHADEKPFCCEICGAKFRANVNFQRHCLTHSTTRPFKCDSCTWDFSQKRLLDHHKTRHHGPDSNSSNKTPSVKIGRTACKFCGKVIQSYSRLQIHLRSHTGEKAYFCDICNRGFNVGCNYRRHMLRHGERKFQCKLCKKSYFEKRHLETHVLRLHTVTRKPEQSPYNGPIMKPAPTACTEVNARFSCPHCPRKYVIEEALSRHLKHNHIPCTTCDKICKNQSEYVNHQLVHTSNRPFSCKVCNKGFKSKKNLIRHGMCHSNHMPHGCKLCGKKFRHPQGIWRHMKYHQTEKPHKCPVCSKGFCHKPDLKRHARIHEHQALQCPVCPSRFQDQDILNLHMSSMHQYNTWICAKCNIAFEDLQELLKHDCKENPEYSSEMAVGDVISDAPDRENVEQSTSDNVNHVVSYVAEQSVPEIVNNAQNFELKQEIIIADNPAGLDEVAQSDAGLAAGVTPDMLRQLEMLSESGQYEQIMLLDAGTDLQYLIVPPDALAEMDTRSIETGVTELCDSVQHVQGVDIQTLAVEEASRIEVVSDSVCNQSSMDIIGNQQIVIGGESPSGETPGEILIATEIDGTDNEMHVSRFSNVVPKLQKQVIQYGHSLLTGKKVLLNPVMETNSRRNMMGVDEPNNQLYRPANQEELSKKPDSQGALLQLMQMPANESVYFLQEQSDMGNVEVQQLESLVTQGHVS